jgi:serine/threonine protein kinase
VGISDDNLNVVTAPFRPPHPRRFGGYVLIEPLDSRGLNEVSLAFSGEAGMEVLSVITRLPRTLSEDPDLLARFREEANLARRLSHGNFPVTTAVGQTDREPFIAQEFVEGHDLAQVFPRCVAEGTLFPTQVALYVVNQLARGLAYAHDFEGLQLVHHDINPIKIRLTYAGEVKLLGFGLATSNQRPTISGPSEGRGGELAYRAPEQRREGPVDRRADLYALGTILWELLTGRRLAEHLAQGAAGSVGGANGIDGAPPGDAGDAALGEIPPPSLFNAAVPDGLDRLTLTALATDPDDRFQTADELRGAIGEFLSPQANVERALGSLMERLYDVRRERERRNELIVAGATVRARRTTGQNPLMRASDRPAVEERNPGLIPSPQEMAAATREPPPSAQGPAVERSRAERFRRRILASAAFALVTILTMVVVVLALRVAAERAVTLPALAGSSPDASLQASGTLPTSGAAVEPTDDHHPLGPAPPGPPPSP